MHLVKTADKLLFFLCVLNKFNLVTASVDSMLSVWGTREFSHALWAKFHHHNDQPIHAAPGYSRCLQWGSYETHKNAALLTIKTDGTYRHQ
jgi:hypothetical protein